MSPTYQRTFKIRYAECDQYNHVNNAVYLHYLQETLIAAEAEAGYPPQRYRELGCEWWPGKTRIEYLNPLLYGDTAILSIDETQLSDTAVQRKVSYRKNGGEVLAGRVSAASIFRKVPGEHQAKIPAEMAEALFSSAERMSTGELQGSSKNEDLPKEAFKIIRTAALKDADPQNRLDLTALMGYAGECGQEVIAAYQWPVERMLEEKTAIWVRSNEINYFRPVKGGEKIEISTWISNIRRSTAIRHYQVRAASSGEVLASVQALGVWVNLDTGQPIRFSERFIKDFTGNIAAEPARI